MQARRITNQDTRTETHKYKITWLTRGSQNWENVHDGKAAWLLGRTLSLMLAQEAGKQTGDSESIKHRTEWPETPAGQMEKQQTGWDEAGTNSENII